MAMRDRLAGTWARAVGGVRSVRLPEVWTAQKRASAVGLLLALTVGLTVAVGRNSTSLPDPAGDGPRATELATRLNPNTADVAALSAVPGVGEARARAIVAYRTDYARRHGGRTPFAQPRDLLPVHGIGVSVVTDLEPYLAFPDRSR